MEDNRTEQIEALETLLMFNEKIIHNIPILVKELSGERLDDTDKLMESMINAVNWEVQVLNSTMDVLNEGKERVPKDLINERILVLSDAIKTREDARLAEAFEALLPALRKIGEAAKEVTAQGAK